MADIQPYSRGVLWFLLGLSVGATAALLIAPQRGRRTRPILKEKLEDGVDAIRDLGHEASREGKRLAKSGARLVDCAKQAMSG